MVGGLGGGEAQAAHGGSMTQGGARALRQNPDTTRRRLTAPENGSVGMIYIFRFSGKLLKVVDRFSCGGNGGNSGQK